MDNEYGKISEEFITQRINWHGKHEPDTTNEAYMEFRQSVERLRENLSDEQRLLLRECENAYHVVDGETERFYYKYGLMDAIRFLLHFGEDESWGYEKRVLTPGEYRQSKFTAVAGEHRSIWDRSIILRMLVDERHLGTYVIGKLAVKEVGGSRTRIKPESEWVKIPNHHTAIIGKELFEEVNAKLLHFKCPKTPREYPLRRKVACGCCKHAMQRIPRKERAFNCRHTLTVETAECHRQ